MKILFCSRDFTHYKIDELTRFYQNEHRNIIKSSFLNTGNGFFYNALKTIGHLDICFGCDQVLNFLRSIKYDLIVFDLKLFLTSKIKLSFFELLNQFNIPKILLYGYDKNISSKVLMKLCSLLDLKAVFIPNLYKNINNYNLPENILKKIHLTYQGMGNQDLVYDHVEKKIKNHFFQNDNFSKKYDFFFAGSTNDNKYLRNEFNKKLKLDPRSKEYKYFFQIFQPTAKVNNLNKFEFVQKMKESNICLDLSGDHDNLTMRFNEIILNGEIPLVDRGFKKYALSNHYENVIDDFCFENMDEFFILLNKYRNKDLRNKTILKINQIWKNYYSPTRHGEEILKTIKI